ncbi:MAG: KAP family NTPase [Pseudomonadota bacterium]
MPTKRPLYDDAPVLNPDDDALGYAPFAKMVAATIRSQSATRGFVFAIHGAWGSGKTTALNFVQHDMTDDGEEITVVKFNPWWFSGQEELTHAFFEELAIAVGAISQETEKAIRKYARRLSGVTSALKYGLKLLPGANHFSDELMNAIGEILKTTGEAVDAPEPVTKVKDEIGSTLVSKGARVLVIIDDIDRLTADEQLQIFKLVKSVADLPNVIYLLAFDADLATGALRARAEYEAQTNFLEKIIQAPFDLPTPSRHSLEDWFVNELNAVIGDRTPTDERRWHDMHRHIVAPRLTTPRAVVKLLNTIRAGWEDIADDVDLTDYIALQTIRLFDKDIYNAIRRHHLWLIGTPALYEGKGEEVT